MKITPRVCPPERVRTRRRFGIGIWAAVVAAVVWRLAVAGEIAGGMFAATIFNPAKTTDLRTYMDLARAISEGGFTGPFYYQPFYYAVFLPFCRLLGGDSVWVVIAVQSLLGGLTALLSGLTAGRLAGRLAGLIAAWLTALGTVLVFYAPFHQIATLQSFNMALMAYLAVVALQRHKLIEYLALGGVAGMAMLTRGNVLLVFLPLLLALGIHEWRYGGWKQGLGAVAAAAVMALAVEAPAIIYNSCQLGHFSGPSTAADAVLALGNTPEAPPGGREPGLPAGPMEYPQAYHEWMATVADTPVWKRILRYCAEEPAAYLELTFRKLLLFWDYREIPNNVALAGEGATSRLLTLTVPSGVILALGLAGMILALGRLWKKHGAWIALYVIVFFYWGATAAFYNLSRFRAPVLPVLAVFAGFAVAELARKWRAGRLRYVRTFGLAALALGIFITFGGYEFYRTRLEASILRRVRPNGTRLRLNDGRSVSFYHGPVTFGGWEMLPAEPGAVFSVKFAPPDGEPAARRAGRLLELGVQAERPGLLVLEIDRRRHRTVFSRPEYQQLAFELPAGGEDVTIRVVENTAGVRLIADFQRNYGATRVNGQPIDGELVARLTR